jgi:hypothetical protein
LVVLVLRDWPDFSHRLGASHGLRHCLVVKQRLTLGAQAKRRLPALAALREVRFKAGVHSPSCCRRRPAR